MADDDREHREHDGTRARLDALTRMLDERENRSLERHNHLKESLDRFMEYTDRRFHASNEWRQAFNDQRTDHISRREYEIQHGSIVDKSETIGARVNLIMGIGFGLNFAIMIAIGIISIYHQHF